MRTSFPHLAALAAAALLAACGDDEKPPPPPACGDLTASALAPGVWRWFPIAGSVCSDGSQTGIGIEKGTSSDVLVFLNGGGACWDYLTCFLAGVATPGPFGAAEFAALIADARAGSVLDRSAPGNPYKDFTFVFVPYCTGDVHSGATVRSYPGAPRPWYHHGRVNVSKAFECLTPALDAPSKVVVAGSSAGGFGSLLAFTKAKAAWPSAKGYLVDDSGPPLANIPTTTIATWVAAWDLGTVVADVCGVACAGVLQGDPPNLAPVIPELAKKYPDDRFALMSSLHDDVIRGFFGTFTLTPPYVTQMSTTDFEAGLRSLAADIEDDAPPGETHAFLVAGTTHPMLDQPGSYTSEGVTLFEWLRRQVEDDPAWSSAIPPP